MRGIARVLGWLLLIGSVLAPVRAQEEKKAAKPQPSAAELKAQAERMDQLLAAWETQSRKVQTLSASFRRTDELKSIDEDEKDYYHGRAFLQAPNLATIQFDRTDKDFSKEADKVTTAERIVCTGEEVWQYVYRDRQIVIYPLSERQKQESVRHGPLPFLFNMRAADAKRRYSMKLTNETDKFYYITIVPLTVEEREDFRQAIVELTKADFQPRRISLLDVNGKDRKMFVFEKITRNPTIRATVFQGQEVPNWKVIRNPVADDEPKVGVGAGTAPNADTRVTPAAGTRGQAARP